MQAGVAADDLRRRRAQPFRERLVDEQKPSGRVHRIETDRRVIKEFDELVPLVPDQRLHFVARGDVLDVPEAVARPSGDRVDRNREPAHGGAARIAQRQRGDGAGPLRGAAAQPFEIGHCVEVGEGRRDRRHRTLVRRRKQFAVCRVGVGDPPVRRQDQLWVGRSVERLGQDIDAPGECCIGPPRYPDQGTEHHRESDDDKRRRRQLVAVDGPGKQQRDADSRHGQDQRDIGELSSPSRTRPECGPAVPAAGIFRGASPGIPLGVLDIGRGHVLCPALVALARKPARPTANSRRSAARHQNC